MNFDGASKGNLGPMGYGGVVKNHEGNIKGVLWGFGREATNNVSKMDGLSKGFLFALQN